MGNNPTLVEKLHLMGLPIRHSAPFPLQKQTLLGYFLSPDWHLQRPYWYNPFHDTALQMQFSSLWCEEQLVFQSREEIRDRQS